MEQNRQTVAGIVRQYLKDCHPGGSDLDVVESKIRKEEFDWYVPVQPNVEPPKLFEYYEALADVEIRIAEQEHTNVFLVPSEPKQDHNIERAAQP